MATAPHTDDQALLQRIARRDEAAMGIFYDRHAPLVYAVSLRILGCREDAEEALLDTFCQVWRRPEAFDAARGRVDGWLVMLARSRALDRLRARGRAEQAVSALQSSGRLEEAAARAGDPEQAAVHRERRLDVRRALMALPSAQRRVLELAFFEGLSQEAIARRDGEPLGTIKTRARLGLGKLRAALDASSLGAMRRG